MDLIEGHMQIELPKGTGIHNCLGQNLARADVGAVLSTVIKKVDSIEFAGEAIWRPNNAIHALDKLPIIMTEN